MSDTHDKDKAPDAPATPPPADPKVSAAPPPADEKKPTAKSTKRKSKELGKGSYVVVETGSYMGQLARIDAIDKPAETVKVSLETGGDPFTLPWPDGVRAAKDDELPDDAIFPEDTE